MDRFTHYAIAASKMAMEDAKVNLEDISPDSIGVILGSGIGGVETFENQHKILLSKGPDRVSPFFIPMMISNMAAAQIAIMTGAKAINETIVSACASSANAVGDAFRAIRHGYVDMVVTGSRSTDYAFVVCRFCSMKAMSTRNDDPKGCCSPFDLNRDGFVMGEGAGL